MFPGIVKPGIVEPGIVKPGIVKPGIEFYFDKFIDLVDAFYDFMRGNTISDFFNYYEEFNDFVIENRLIL